MSKSQRLRLQDVRNVYRLVGECRELGADAPTWRRHAASGLMKLADAYAATAGEMTTPITQGVQGILQAANVGWLSPRQAEYQLAYQCSPALARDPFLCRFDRLPGRFHTRSPEQLLDIRRWRATRAFNEYFRPAGIDAGLYSQQALAGGTFSCLSLHRPLGASLFGRRERWLVHLFHQEIGPLIGHALAAAREPSLSDLSPRVRQTLDCLLDGDSEKQAASRLGVSRATVHEYVGELYRHFGVASRAELMAHFLRRFRGGRP